MTINQVITVIVLIESNFNVSATAKKLHKVQSAISNQIRSLEQELGGPLFERKGKRLVGTTPLCDELIPQFKLMLDIKDNIKVIGDEYAKEDIGELRIATTNTQARHFLPAVIDRFRVQYPQVRLSLNLDNPSNFLSRVADRSTDVAIFAEKLLTNSKLSAVDCYKWNRNLVVRKDHPLAKQEITLEAIAAYPIVTYAKGYADYDLIKSTFEKQGLEIDIACATGDGDLILNYTQLSIGVGIVSQVADLEKQEDLVFIDVSHLFEPSITRAIYDDSRIQRKYIKAFIEILQDEGQKFEKAIKNQKKKS